MQPPQIGGGLFCASHIRIADNLNERHARPVQVHVTRRQMLIVNHFACIFLHVNPRYADSLFFFVLFNIDISMFGKRLGILGNLIPFGEVRIEIVFPRKGAYLVNLTISRQCHFYCVLDDLPVQNGQDTGHTDAYGTGVGIGHGPKNSRAGAEYF